MGSCNPVGRLRSAWLLCGSTLAVVATCGMNQWMYSLSHSLLNSDFQTNSNKNNSNGRGINNYFFHLFCWTNLIFTQKVLVLCHISCRVKGGFITLDEEILVACLSVNVCCLSNSFYLFLFDVRDIFLRKSTVSRSLTFSDKLEWWLRELQVCLSKSNDLVMRCSWFHPFHLREISTQSYYSKICAFGGTESAFSCRIWFECTLKKHIDSLETWRMLLVCYSGNKIFPLPKTGLVFTRCPCWMTISICNC